MWNRPRARNLVARYISRHARWASYTASASVLAACLALALATSARAEQDGTNTPAPTPVSKVTPTPGSAPTPVALNNPQNPVSYGADATGTRDNTSAFQSAINAGDLDIHAGVYKILGMVTVPDARNIRCESGASLAHQTSTSSWTMFQFNGNSSGSVFNCQFRG